MKTNVKQWFINQFPEDELGQEIDDKITFKNVLNALKKGFDIYNFIDVYDSVVRERIFGGLAEKMEVPYSEVYNIWMDNINN